MCIFLVFYKVQLVSNRAKRHIIYNIGVFLWGKTWISYSSVENWYITNNAVSRQITTFVLFSTNTAKSKRWIKKIPGYRNTVLLAIALVCGIWQKSVGEPIKWKYTVVFAYE